MGVSDCSAITRADEQSRCARRNRVVLASRCWRRAQRASRVVAIRGQESRSPGRSRI